MTTANELITRVRSRLDETTPAFWTDANLIVWLNEGLRDAGRYTRHIRDTKTINVTAGVSEYTVQADVIEIENAFYLPGDGRQISLTGQSRDTVASWGSWQNIGGEPAAFSLWGTPPLLKIKLYPTPEVSRTGGLSLLVTRLPAVVTTGADVVDFPPGWEDVIEDYMEMAALRKARDQRWQEAFQMYTSKRDNLDVNGHYGNDPETFVYDGYAGVMPRWLVEF